MQRHHKILMGVLVIGLGSTLGYCASVQPGSLDSAPPVRATAATAAPAPLAEPDAPGPLAAPRWAPDPLVPPFVPRPYPFLADEDATGSISVGTVTNGTLVNGRPLLMPSPDCAILPRQAARDLAYGSDAMISVIQTAAAAVHARHGRRMWVGNIGRRGGGDIPWSVSHNTGRDADLAFCTQSPSGEPVDPPDLVPLDADGVSEQYDGQVRFDAACTWTMVEALLSQERAQVQYLFISGPLKAKLLAYARRKGVKPALIERAEAVLGQPGLSLPHNDHLHIRLYCSKRDVEGGCVNQGKTHAGVDLFEDARIGRIKTVARMLTHEEPEQRARAIERLVLLRANAQSSSIARRLEDDSPRVRGAAARGLGDLGAVKEVGALIGRFEAEADPGVQVAILEAVTSLGGRDGARLLARVIGDPAFDAVEVGPLPRPIRVAYTPPEPDPREVVQHHAEALAAAEDPVHRALGQPIDAPHYLGRALPLDGRSMTLRLAAIEQAAQCERAEPAEALINALDHEDPLVRGRAARALHRLTNQAFEVAWDDPALSQAQRREGVAAWRAWWARSGKLDRATWLAQGFTARGFEVPRLSRKVIWELVRAVTADEFLSYNAQRALMRLSQHEPLSLTWPRRDAAWHWTRWFDRRRRTFGLPPCPAALSTYNR